jgi:hypothetical protein
MLEVSSAGAGSNAQVASSIGALFQTMLKIFT